MRTNQVSLPRWQTAHIASRAPQQSAHWPCHLIVDHAVPQTAKTISCAILFQPIAGNHFTIREQPICLLFNCHLQTLAGLFCHPVNQPPYITCCIQASPFLHRKKCTGGPFRGAPETAPTTSRHIYAPADGTQTSRQKHYISFFGGTEMFTIVLILCCLGHWSTSPMCFLLNAWCNAMQCALPCGLLFFDICSILPL